MGIGRFQISGLSAILAKLDVWAGHILEPQLRRHLMVLGVLTRDIVTFD